LGWGLLEALRRRVTPSSFGLSAPCHLLGMSRDAFERLLAGKSFKEFCDACGWNTIKCKGGFPKGSRT
jgi:hypothetical protein